MDGVILAGVGSEGNVSLFSPCQLLSCLSARRHVARCMFFVFFSTNILDVSQFGGFAHVHCFVKADCNSNRHARSYLRLCCSTKPKVRFGMKKENPSRSNRHFICKTLSDSHVSVESLRCFNKRWETRMQPSHHQARGVKRGCMYDLKDRVVLFQSTIGLTFSESERQNTYLDKRGRLINTGELYFCFVLFYFIYFVCFIGDGIQNVRWKWCHCSRLTNSQFWYIWKIVLFVKKKKSNAKYTWSLFLLNCNFTFQHPNRNKNKNIWNI